MTESTKKTSREKSEPKPVIKLPVKRMDGSVTGEEVELNSDLFGLERNDHVLYLAVKAEMNNMRQGTRSTQTRSMVRGGGRKPFRQKGRGTARAGTIRSPIWRGGAVTFGPEPKVYSMRLPRKVKRLARRVALSLKVRAGVVDCVEDFTMDQPKTAKIAGILSGLEVTGNSALLLLEKTEPAVVKSCRNIPRLEVREALNASVYDIMRARRLIISRSAIDSMNAGLINEK